MSVHRLPLLQDEEVLMTTGYTGRIFRDEESLTPDVLAADKAAGTAENPLNKRPAAVSLTDLPPDLFAMVSVINRFHGSLT